MFDIICSSGLFFNTIVIKQKGIDMKKAISTIVMLKLLLLAADVWAYSVVTIQKWGINQNDVIKKYLSNANYKQYALNQIAGYNNKLLNYILAIDADYKNKITIFRTGKGITRDFMFIGTKLYVVTDYMQLSNAESSSEVISALGKIYGTPQKQTEANTTTYTYTKDQTKIIAILEAKGQKYSMTIYYYYKNLFKSLLQ